MSAFALILAGGSGTRFWPQSRSDRPKQLLPLAGTQSLLQETVSRVQGLIEPSRVYVVTSEIQRAAVVEQLPEVPPEQILSEPVGRDTAAAIGYGCAAIAERDPEAVVAVMPSDHVIRPSSKFADALRSAIQHVRKSDDIAIFGIPPAHPSTAFGYIERGRKLESEDGYEIFTVKDFREKPNRATAEEFLASGHFYWNAGIFVWQAARLLKGLKDFLPKTHAGLLEILRARDTDAADQVLARVYPEFQKISIDFAFMEKVDGGLVVFEADFQWNDIGSWNALEKIYHNDREGNTLLGRVVALDTANTTAWTDDQHVIGLIGVKDLVVVRTEDATLIVAKDQVERVKDLVAELHKRGLEAYT